MYIDTSTNQTILIAMLIAFALGFGVGYFIGFIRAVRALCRIADRLMDGNPVAEVAHESV